MAYFIESASFPITCWCCILFIYFIYSVIYSVKRSFIQSIIHPILLSFSHSYRSLFICLFIHRLFYPFIKRQWYSFPVAREGNSFCLDMSCRNTVLVFTSFQFLFTKIKHWRASTRIPSWSVFTPLLVYFSNYYCYWWSPVFSHRPNSISVCH